jgi:hypothetical protein
VRLTKVRSVEQIIKSQLQNLCFERRQQYPADTTKYAIITKLANKIGIHNKLILTSGLTEHFHIVLTKVAI